VKNGMSGNFLPPSPSLANNFGPGIWMFSCNCVESAVEVKEAVGIHLYFENVLLLVYFGKAFKVFTLY
jgi:hypothetical protein